MKEYHGRFRTKILGEKFNGEPQIRELTYWCNKFYRHGFAGCKDYSSGNLSFRPEKGKNSFIITGSGVMQKSYQENNCFVKVLDCDLERRVIYASGTKKPSSESMLHYLIYKKRRDINAVFHGHCKKILALAGDSSVTETKKEEPSGSLELAERVAEILGKNKFILMKNHGFVSLGRNMEEAGNIALRMHKRAKSKS